MPKTQEQPFAVGMKVLWSPELIHALGAFRHYHDGQDWKPLFRYKTVTVNTPRGAEERTVAEALMHWQATILRVNDDGTCDLEIKHPGGHATFYYPDRSPYTGPLPEPPGYLPPEARVGVRYDKKKTPHTFHLDGD